MTTGRRRLLALALLAAVPSAGCQCPSAPGRDTVDAEPREEQHRGRDAEAPVVAVDGGGDGSGTGRVEPVPSDIECLVPAIAVPRAPECDAGAPYPRCRHRLPDPDAAGGLYDIWRNTIPAHLWGRPALVSLVLATAREYARRHPGERITVGDLDAPGPRHRTHRNGVDVDLYLPGLMATENAGRRSYPSNYEGRPADEVRRKRARVLTLATIVGSCAGGRLRIYYNDPEVVEAYERWFDRAGLTTPFGRPMEPHNALHLFHFHVTIAPDLETLPVEATPPVPAVGGSPETPPAGNAVAPDDEAT